MTAALAELPASGLLPSTANPYRAKNKGPTFRQSQEVSRPSRIAAFNPGAEAGSSLSRHDHIVGVGDCEDGLSVGSRRVDPLCGDIVLQIFGLLAGEADLAIPALGI